MTDHARPVTGTRTFAAGHRPGRRAATIGRYELSTDRVLVTIGGTRRPTSTRRRRGVAAWPDADVDRASAPPESHRSRLTSSRSPPRRHARRRVHTRPSHRRRPSPRSRRRPSTAPPTPAPHRRGGDRQWPASSAPTASAASPTSISSRPSRTPSAGRRAHRLVGAAARSSSARTRAARATCSWRRSRPARRASASTSTSSGVVPTPALAFLAGQPGRSPPGSWSPPRTTRPTTTASRSSTRDGLKLDDDDRGRAGAADLAGRGARRRRQRASSAG